MAYNDEVVQKRNEAVQSGCDLAILEPRCLQQQLPPTSSAGYRMIFIVSACHGREAIFSTTSEVVSKYLSQAESSQKTKSSYCASPPPLFCTKGGGVGVYSRIFFSCIIMKYGRHPRTRCWKHGHSANVEKSTFLGRTKNDAFSHNMLKDPGNSHTGIPVAGSNELKLITTVDRVWEQEYYILLPPFLFSMSVLFPAGVR